MPALEVPEEAIEKAALALRSPSHRPGPPDVDLVEIWKRTARITLEAAAPLIVAAAMVALADEVEGQPVELVDLMGEGKHYNAGKGYVAGLLRSRARDLRGEPAVLPCGHLADYVENDEVTADEHERCRASVLRGEGDPK